MAGENLSAEPVTVPEETDAFAFATEGANVVMFSRHQETIEAAAMEVRSVALNGAQILAVTADVTRLGDLQHVVKETVDRFDGADIVFNNAGGPMPGVFDDLTDDDWHAAVDLSLMSAIRLTRLCLPYMSTRRWGRVIVSTSYSVKQPIPTLMLSNAVRSATTAWAKSLSDQVAQYGITVNALAPGQIETERVRQFEEDVARRESRTPHAEPAEGRRKWRNGTLRNVYSAVRLLLAWMVANGYSRFAELDHRATRQFAAHLRTRRGRRGELTPSALRHHLMLLVALYEHRKELPDAPLVHPLDGETETAYAGARGREGAPIPHIPDDIATYVIGAALTWVTTYAPAILEAERTVFDPALTVDAKSPSIARRRRRMAGRGLPLASPIAWQGQTCSLLPDLRLLERFREHLVYACYIIIASHTGMRASEIGAMQTDCLETTASDGGRPLLFVRSRLFKTAADEDGVETRWVAGRDHARNPVRLAVQALIELRRIHAADATTAGLWAIAIGRWTAAARSYAAFSAWTNTFARTSGLPRPWTFSSHQFRKTFARWIVIHHKVDMLALRDHFKHVSVVMTDQYVGDVELLELIGEAQLESAAYELGLCLNADRLAGKAGEELLRTNTRFRGEARRPFAMEYAREMVGDGFIVLPNEYGICLYDAETARCHGDFARVGVETCLRCANAILGPQHLPFWRELTADAAALRESIATIPCAETAVAALDDRIVAFRTVVTNLEGEAVLHDAD